MVKQKASKKPIFNIVLIAIIVVLFISNIFFIIKYKSINQEDFITEQVLFKETKKDYNKNTKYYANIKYKKFNSLWKSNQLSTIAVVDNSSTTYNRFIELINKTAYYKNTKIYLLETSKLSKKDELKFYEKDNRLSKLETNYIITICNKKIITITTFDKEELNSIIEGLGE